MDSGFKVLDSSLSEWNLDSGFQSLVGFQILCELYSGFQSQGFRNSQANFPGFRNPDCLTWAGKLGLTQSVSARRLREKIEEPIVANTREIYLGYQRFFLACGD